MTRLPSALRPLFPLVKPGVLAGHAGGQPADPAPARRDAASRTVPASASDYARAHPARWRRGGGGGRRAGSRATASGGTPGRPPAIRRAPPRRNRGRMSSPPCATAACSTPYGAVITEDDTLLFDLSPYYGVADADAAPRLPALPPAGGDHGRPGSVGVLTTRGAATTTTTSCSTCCPGSNCCAGPASARRVPGQPRDPVPTRPARPPRSDGRPLPGHGRVPASRADELVVPSLPDDQLRTPPWIVPWLRAQFLPDDVRPPHRRLYVSRGRAKHTRRVENEAELLAALEPLGFRGPSIRRAVAGRAGARLRRGGVHRRAARRRPDQSGLRVRPVRRWSSCSPATT